MTEEQAEAMLELLRAILQQLHNIEMSIEKG